MANKGNGRQSHRRIRSGKNDTSVEKVKRVRQRRERRDCEVSSPSIGTWEDDDETPGALAIPGPDASDDHQQHPPASSNLDARSESSTASSGPAAQDNEDQDYLVNAFLVTDEQNEGERASGTEESGNASNVPIAEAFSEKPWYRRRPFQIVSSLLVTAIIVAVVIPITRPTESPSNLPPTLSPMPSSIPSAPPSSIFSIKIEIQLDDYPGDTGWTLECDDLELRSIGSGNYTTAGQLVLETFYIREGSECFFRITDTGGDGICCGLGQGFYKLYGDGDDNTTIRSNVFAEGGQFKGFAEHEFVASSTWLLSMQNSPTASTVPTFLPTSSPAPTQRPWFQIGENIVGSTMTAEAGKSVSLSIDGNILAIGQFEDGQGSVRVLARNGTDWTQLGQIIRGENDGDEFGRSVSLSGDGLVMAVGGPRNDGDFKIFAGHVQIFQYKPSSMTWDAIGQEIIGNDAFDQFGFSVSLNTDGTILACGAPKRNEIGYVRIYQYKPELGWSQVGDNILGERANDNTGSSVSLSSDGLHIAISSPYHSGVQRDQSGRVRVFQLENDNNWNQVGQSLDGIEQFQLFGISISLSGAADILAIGADAYPPFISVFQYDMSFQNWTQIGADIVGGNDELGKSISLSKDGKVLVAGAPSGGFARVLKYNAGQMSWEPVGQDIFGDLYGEFGLSTSTSGNGSVVAIGAPMLEGQGTVQVFSRY